MAGKPEPRDAVGSSPRVSGPSIRSNAVQDDLSREVVFEVLSNRRRRYTFHYLKREDRTVYVRELADRLTAWENDKVTDEITAQERKRVKTALQQHHLPKMDDMGFVVYDSQRGTVQLSDSMANLEVYLDVVPSLEIPWGLYYLGLGTVGGAGLAAITLDLVPPSLLSEFTWSVFCTVTLLVSALVHVYFSYSRLRFGSEEAPPEVTEL